MLAASTCGPCAGSPLGKNKEEVKPHPTDSDRNPFMGQSPHHLNPLRLSYPTLVLSKEPLLDLLAPGYQDTGHTPKLARVSSCTVNSIDGRIGRVEEKGKADDPRVTARQPPNKALSQNHTRRRQRVR